MLVGQSQMTVSVCVCVCVLRPCCVSLTLVLDLHSLELAKTSVCVCVYVCQLPGQFQLEPRDLSRGRDLVCHKEATSRSSTPSEELTSRCQLRPNALLLVERAWCRYVICYMMTMATNIPEDETQDTAAAVVELLNSSSLTWSRWHQIKDTSLWIQFALASPNETRQRESPSLSLSPSFSLSFSG